MILIKLILESPHFLLVSPVLSHLQYVLLTTYLSYSHPITAAAYNFLNDIHEGLLHTLRHVLSTATHVDIGILLKDQAGDKGRVLTDDMLDVVLGAIGVLSGEGC